MDGWGLLNDILWYGVGLNGIGNGIGNWEWEWDWEAGWWEGLGGVFAFAGGWVLGG